MTRRPTTLGQRDRMCIEHGPGASRRYLSQLAVTRACGGIAVTVSVLDQSEIEDVFGARLDLASTPSAATRIPGPGPGALVALVRTTDKNCGTSG
jgi:hypothetical protein